MDELEIFQKYFQYIGYTYSAVPGCLLEYDQNKGVYHYARCYPGIYASMIKTTTFDTRVPGLFSLLNLLERE